MRYYLNNFFLFSIFGFFFETFMFDLFNLHNQSGFMYLSWTPFYGTAIIIIILIKIYIYKLNLSTLKKHLILATSLFITLTLLELIGGIVLEYLHGYPLWTYDFLPLHIGNFISIPSSILWVIMSYIYLFIIKKYSDNLIERIPKSLTITLTLVFICDFILTMIKLISIKLS